jgi:hypothetical protein
MPTVRIGRVVEEKVKNGFARELAMMAFPVFSPLIFPGEVRLEHLGEDIKSSFLWIYLPERVTSEVKISSGHVFGRPRIVVVDSGGRLSIDGAFAIY